MELLTTLQMDRSAQSFHHDLTFSQLCSMWSYRSIDPDFVPLPGPRRSGYICGCSGQQLCFTAGLCNAPFMPIAFLFFSSTSALVHFLSTSFLLHLRFNTPETLALHCEKRIPGLEDQSEFYGVAEGDEKWADFQSIQCLTFSLLTAPQSFLQLHAVCPVSADWLHCRLSSALQLQSGRIPIIAETLMRVLTGDIHCSLLFLCFCLLTSQKN